MIPPLVDALLEISVVGSFTGIGPAVRRRLFRRPRPFDRVPSTRLSAADRRRLWDLVVGLSGGTDPAARR